MKIIDPHIHLWDLSLKKHAWLSAREIHDFHGDMTPILRDFLLTDYLKLAKDVELAGFVYLQCGWGREDIRGELDWLHQETQDSTLEIGVSAYANLIDEQIEDLLAHYQQKQAVSAIRQNLNWHEDPFHTGCHHDYLSMPAWQKAFSLLKKYELAFDMQIYPHQYQQAFDLLKQHDETSVIINHFGLPMQHDKAYRKNWRQQLKKLADLPNVKIKLSGFNMFEHVFNHETLREFILDAIDLFGTDRAMFASNFPIDSLYVDFNTLYQHYTDIVSDFSLAQRLALFYTNAKETYQLTGA